MFCLRNFTEGFGDSDHVECACCSLKSAARKGPKAHPTTHTRCNDNSIIAWRPPMMCKWIHSGFYLATAPDNLRTHTCKPPIQWERLAWSEGIFKGGPSWIEANRIKRVLQADLRQGSGVIHVGVPRVEE